MRLIDADKLKPDMKVFLSAYAEELTKCYSQEKIDKALTIDAVPVRHGEWLDKCCEVQCSCCGETYSDEIFLMRGKVNYCPNCGAKLENNVFS